MKRVLVTGATGQIGAEVVDQLRATGCHIRALTRNPARANFPANVEIAQGDLAAPETLDEHLTGVDAVFLVWTAPVESAAIAVERIASHAERIVLPTSPHRTPHPFFQQPNKLRSMHAAVEQIVESSGARWTFLRPGPFALNCRNWWAPQIKNSDTVRWFYGGAATAPVHERDIAAVAVRTLCDEGHRRREYVLTGPESLTQRDQVSIIGAAIGRRLKYEEFSAESAKQELVEMMMPPTVADMLLSAYRAAVGAPAFVNSAIQEVTGRPAATFEQWALDHASEFTTPARAV
jgi:uncharacterized protein YbjT (DUF2867 family)